MSGSKPVGGFSIISFLKWIMTSESQRILFNKNKKFIKNETDSKMENLTHSFRDMKLVLQLI